MAVATVQLPDFSFQDAAKHWVEQKSLLIQPRTAKDYRNYIKTLTAFFGARHLSSIRLPDIQAYQQWRAENGVGPVAINHEVGCLSQLMRAADLWEKAFLNYRPLRVNDRGPGVALTTEQLKKLFEAARKDTRWQVALHASVLSANTTAAPGEIKQLRVGDVILNQETPVIHIRKGKNKFRTRTVPLNPDAVTSARFLVQRAIELGSQSPDDFLLPHRGSAGKKGYDFTRPQSHWNKAWDKVRKAAGLPKLRQYDLRHTGISRLLENPNIPERVVSELAGHVSAKMLERYGHLRMQAKADAVNAVSVLSVEPETDKKAPVAPEPDALRGMIMEVLRSVLMGAK